MAKSSLEALLDHVPQKPQHLDRGADEDVSVNLAMAKDPLYPANRRQSRRLPMQGCKLKVKSDTLSTATSIDAVAEGFPKDGVRFVTKANLRRDETTWIHITPDFAATNIRPFQIANDHSSSCGVKIKSVTME